MRLHPNINPKDLTADGRLLSQSEVRLIKEIEAFIKTLAPEIQQFKINRQSLASLQHQYEIATNLYQYIDELLIQQAADPNDIGQNYQERVSKNLQDLRKHAKSQGTQEFLDQFIQTIQARPASYEYFSECLADIWDAHADAAQDTILIQDLEKMQSELNDLCERTKCNIQKQCAQFKEKNALYFELNDDFQLTKISRKSPLISWSVIYVQPPNVATPIAVALYRGKEGKMLGEGGFGKVKLCQNINTGEWMAIKIQQHIMQQPSQAENKVLSEFDRFIGEALRDSKYYSVQQLLLGTNLANYIEQHPKDNLKTRILIAKKAAHLVDEFHQKHLHRDIKPENLIWDKNTQELYLCDFGMAIAFDSEQDGILDRSGSGTFLAPEIDDALHSGSVKHTKKKRIFMHSVKYLKNYLEIFIPYRRPSVH